MMTIEEVTYQEFGQLFPKPNVVFDSASFAELNQHKVSTVRCLAIRDNKLRFGVVLGERDEFFSAPFSAPFATFTCNKSEKIEHYEAAVESLKCFPRQNSKPIRFVLPPSIYGPETAKLFIALQRLGASIEYSDLNYHFSLARYCHYVDYLDGATRNKFYNSIKHCFVFSKLDSANCIEVERAYSVIKQNREERGFPLRMSLQDVIDTIRIIPADFFVMSYEGTDIAAAQVFHVTDDIAQVIYWGDLREYSHLRTMNFFTYKLFGYYYETGIKVLDIGPSTERGVPNYGLCEFKENIGCELSLKHTLLLA